MNLLLIIICLFLSNNIITAETVRAEPIAVEQQTLPWLKETSATNQATKEQQATSNKEVLARFIVSDPYAKIVQSVKNNEKISDVLRYIHAGKKRHVEIASYIDMSADADKTKLRRASLKRATRVRNLLISKGLKPYRIVVKLFAGSGTSPHTNRVDVTKAGSR